MSGTNPTVIQVGLQGPAGAPSSVPGPSGPTGPIGPAGNTGYIGTWNASTNTPALTSSTPPAGVTNPNGAYFPVAVAGTHTLDGISSWNAGDWAIWNGTTSTWNRLALGAILGLGGGAYLNVGTGTNTLADGGVVNVLNTSYNALISARGARAPYAAEITVNGKQLVWFDYAANMNLGSINVNALLQSLKSYFLNTVYNLTSRTPWAFRAIFGGRLGWAIAANGDFIAKGGNFSAALASLSANNAAVAANSAQLNGNGFWQIAGDSMVQGAYQDSGYDICSQLALELGVSRVYNLGRNGQTAEGVLSRMGGLPGYCVFPSNTIPASGAVQLTSFSNADMLANWGQAHGYVCGIYGTMDYGVTTAGQYTFTRATAGTAVYAPSGSAFNIPTNNQLGYAAAAPGVTYFVDQASNAVFWWGQNDVNYLSGTNYSAAGVLANDFAAVNFLKPLKKNYLFLSIVGNTTWGTTASPTAQTIMRDAINANRLANFPRNFLDIRTLLIQNGNGSTQDNSDIANGWIPTSLRSTISGPVDTQHLSDQANVLIARWIYQWFNNLPIV